MSWRKTQWAGEYIYNYCSTTLWYRLPARPELGGKSRRESKVPVQPESAPLHHRLRARPDVGQWWPQRGKVLVVVQQHAPWREARIAVQQHAPGSSAQGQARSRPREVSESEKPKPWPDSSWHMLDSRWSMLFMKQFKTNWKKERKTLNRHNKI